MRNGLYDLDGKLEQEIAKLGKCGISKRNIELILDFRKHNVMCDLTNKGFNSNSPAKNYARPSERMDEMQTRIRKLEQEMLQLTTKG
ncbi:MAG: hypothetical protein AABW99_03335 [archaeon]